MTDGTLKSQGSFVGGGEAQQAARPMTEAEKKFHQAFPNVPITEKLVEDYSCSYSKNKIIRPGKLYVTGVRCCFLASIGDSFQIQWQDVQQIEKKSKLIATVIEIFLQEGGMSYAFTAFGYGSGDNVYKTLQMLHSLRRGYQQREAQQAALKQSASQGNLAASPPNNQSIGSQPATSNAFTSEGGAAAAEQPAAAKANNSSSPYPPGTISSNNDPVTTQASNVQSSSTTSGLGAAAPAAEPLPPAEAIVAAAGKEEDQEEEPLLVTKNKSGSNSPTSRSFGSKPKEATNDPTASSSVPSTPDVSSSLASTPQLNSEVSPSVGGGALPTSFLGQAMVGEKDPLATTQSPQQAPLKAEEEVAPEPEKQTTITAAPPAGSASTPPQAPAESPKPNPSSPSAEKVTSPSPSGNNNNKVKVDLDDILGPKKGNQRQKDDKTTGSNADAPPAQEKSNSSPEASPNSPSTMPIVEQSTTTATESQSPPPQQQPEDESNKAKQQDQGTKSSDQPTSKSKRSNIVKREKQEFEQEGIGANNKAHYDVLKSFPSVPKTENILDTFQCSFVSGVHRIGKMHITGHYILFNSMMMAENVVIKFTEVASVEKLQTMLILDGISVMTYSGEKYDWTSFINREAAFTILKQLFDTHQATANAMGIKRELVVPEPSKKEKEKAEKKKKKESSDAVAADEGSKSPSNTSMAVATSPSSSEVLSSPTKEASATASVASPTTAPPPVPTASASAPSGSGGGEAISLEFKTPFAKMRPNCDYPSASSIDEWDNLGHAFGDTGITPKLANVFKEGKELQGATGYTFPVGIDINDVFRVGWDDQCGLPVRMKYHELRKDSKIEYENWRQCTGSAASDGYSGFREMKGFCVIRALTATTCSLTEYTKFWLTTLGGKPTLCVLVAAQAKGIPFSETFRAETFYQYTQEGSGATAQVTVKTTLNILFIKKVWGLSGKIWSNATPEAKDGVKMLAEDVMVPALNEHKGKQANAPAATAGTTAPAAVVVAAAPVSAGSSQHGSPTSTSSPRGFSSGGGTVAAVTLPKEAIMAMKGLTGASAFFLVLALWSIFWMPTYIDDSSDNNSGSTSSEDEMATTAAAGKSFADVGLAPLYPIITSAAAITRNLLFAVVFFVLSRLPVWFFALDHYSKTD